MSVIDRQQQEFVGGVRLVDMTLGLAAIGDRVAGLLAAPAGGNATSRTDEPLAYALLGMLSLRRTLWAALAVQPDAGAPPPAHRGESPPPAGLLR